MAFSKIGVVGCGLMGSGIAQVCAQKGFRVVVREANQELLQKGLDRIKGFLAEGVKRGKVQQADMDKTLANLKGTTNLRDLADVDIVIEAITENMDAKKALWKELDGICKRETIFASNTSSLSITEMASVTQRQGKFIGMHFMNPVPLMKLVEIVRPEIADPDTYESVRQLGESLGKILITAKDTPGFIVNLLLVPFLCEAVRAVENGLATPQDIDTGMKLGCGHPMGPLELADYVGLDTTLYIADVIYGQFKDPKYAAPPLLRRMVMAGRLGRKTGRGFYEWEGDKRK
ncbi:MAG TPA: 3-hydroxybutyryl-CoA dehydrogenase [Planctomycetota bacterium]|nr:3-hydroxybutyryl-CoA dehydrogenase [Planctomycetota bacterium]